MFWLKFTISSLVTDPVLGHVEDIKHKEDPTLIVREVSIHTAHHKAM